jgi:peptide/nickel transport system ATP-binding protein/oligopeptide transport system ATP-binding protein
MLVIGDIMTKILLKVDKLTKYFNISGSFVKKQNRKIVRAVDEISFDIKAGEIFSLVGESGCGKSTTARLILRLIKETSGEVIFNDKSVFTLSDSEMQQERKNMQMIFQDPYSSLNPRMKVKDILAEPLLTHKFCSRSDMRNRINEMLDMVDLKSSYAERYPHEFSAGQRQRIGIARALCLNPKLVICDEPMSALDASIQAQIINLLNDLKVKFNLTYLFITHDLRMVSYFCDVVAIMYLGNIVEQGPITEIFKNPMHPYTKALFSAIPYPDPTQRRKRIILEGDIPNNMFLSGCPFYTRCPSVMEMCKTITPKKKMVGNNHHCKCHLCK